MVFKIKSFTLIPNLKGHLKPKSKKKYFRNSDETVTVDQIEFLQINFARSEKNEKNTPLYFLFLDVSRSIPIIIFRVPFVFHASPIEDDLKVYFITD